MEAFFRFIREESVKENLKSTFDLSAKFKYPTPSEAQKSKYFDEQFINIFKDFYLHLRKNNTLLGKSDAQVEINLKNKIDQSILIIEFDSWLDQLDSADQFVFIDKVKPVYHHQNMHNTYSNPNTAINQHKQPITPTTPRPTQAKTIQTTPTFIIEKNPPPSTQPVPMPKKGYPNDHILIPLPADPPRKHIPPTHPYQASLHYVANGHKADKVDDKEKPYKVRFIEKLSEYMDCPERYNIIKAELHSITKKNST